MKRSLLLVFIAFFLFGSVASAAKLRTAHSSLYFLVWRFFIFKAFLHQDIQLRGIFGLFGAGYTQSDLKFKWTNGSTTYTTNAIDVSLTPIDLFTVGYGIVTGGGVSNGTLDSSSGSTTFFNLNFGLGPVDLLAGYRMWDATHKFKNSSETKLKYNEIGLGVGFGF